MDGIEVEGQDRQASEPGKRTRRLWTAKEKRQILREAQRPGAVRQAVAQRHGVHVSVMNRWRTEQLSKSSIGKKTVAISFHGLVGVAGVGGAIVVLSVRRLTRARQFRWWQIALIVLGMFVAAALLIVLALVAIVLIRSRL
jgi:transposase-like protein